MFFSVVLCDGDRLAPSVHPPGILRLDEIFALGVADFLKASQELPRFQDLPLDGDPAQV